MAPLEGASPLNEGQDYILATTWYNATVARQAHALNEGQDYILATTPGG